MSHSLLCHGGAGKSVPRLSVGVVRPRLPVTGVSPAAGAGTAVEVSALCESESGDKFEARWLPGLVASVEDGATPRLHRTPRCSPAQLDAAGGTPHSVRITVHVDDPGQLPDKMVRTEVGGTPRLGAPASVLVRARSEGAQGGGVVYCYSRLRAVHVCSVESRARQVGAREDGRMDQQVSRRRGQRAHACCSAKVHPSTQANTVALSQAHSQAHSHTYADTRRDTQTAERRQRDAPHPLKRTRTHSLLRHHLCRLQL